MGVIETIMRKLNEIKKKSLLMILGSNYAYSCDKLVDFWGDLGSQEGNDCLELDILQVCSVSAPSHLCHCLTLCYGPVLVCTEEKLPDIAKYLLGS